MSLALQQCQFSHAQCQLENCLLFSADPPEHCLRPCCGPRVVPQALPLVHLSPLTTCLELGVGTVPLGCFSCHFCHPGGRQATRVSEWLPLWAGTPLQAGAPTPHGANCSQWGGEVGGKTMTTSPFLSCARARGRVVAPAAWPAASLAPGEPRRALCPACYPGTTSLL